jgi:recombination protein RecR
MASLPENIQKVIEGFAKLPGIGQKSAERLTFYLLRKPDHDVQEFASAIENLKTGLNQCVICSNLTQGEKCAICMNDKRDPSVVCVVEEVLDLIALEKTGEFKGLYHVLHGVISPVEGVGPDELKIKELVDRVKSGTIKEIIFALNPALEGEATIAYILRLLKAYPIKATRIARGIPMGGDLEYADSQTLRQAMAGRQEY